MKEFNAELKLSVGAIRNVLLWAVEQGHINEDAANLLISNMYEEAEKENEQ